MPSRNRIIHIMNTAYGKADQYGARSRWIARYMDQRTSVFARANAVENPDLSDDVDFHKVHIPVLSQAKRYIHSLLGQGARKHRVIWKAFDHAVAREIQKLDLDEYSVLHTWEWVPETIQAVKARNPRIKIVRDVVINRYNEYWSGAPITEEDPLVDLFLSPSSFSTSLLISWGIPAAKIAEIPFGVDCGRFKPNDEKPASPMRLAFSGGLSKRKGVDTLLRAWEELAPENTELHLYGHIRNDVQAYLKKARGVVCHGHIDLEEELPKNHIFVFPSTLEGSAKSVYEALAAGLPVITTPDSGSIVRNGVDGILVETGNEGELAAAMSRLITDGELRNLMGKNARKRALAYTWDRYSDAVAAAYNSQQEREWFYEHIRDNAGQKRGGYHLGMSGRAVHMDRQSIHSR